MEAVKDRAVKAKLEQIGATIIGAGPAEIRRHADAERAKWVLIAKAAGN